MLHIISRGVLRATAIQNPATVLEGARRTMSDKANIITYNELKAALAGEAVQIFDVRSLAEVDKGKIPNSTNIPVDDVEAALKMEPEAFKQKYLVEKPKLEDENIVFHCQMGKRGARATEIAQSLGYSKARNYAGAYKEWSEKEGK